jgi:5-methylcytosine-specific restriction protein B
MASDLSWGAAKALFDANFIFRKNESETGDRWYRKDANGPYIWVKEQDGAVVVGLHDSLDSLPEGVSKAEAGVFSLTGLHCYQVDSMAGLEYVVSVFNKAPVEMVVAAKPVSPLPEASTVLSIKAHQMASNTILYGPPGTGKTYATSRHAVLLCDGVLPGDGSQAAIRRRFEELRLAGRVSFVTFHQSYGYEEFVEGLRPHVGESGQVAYSVRPGVFQTACTSAKLQRLVTPGLKGKPLQERTIFKMSLGATWKEEGKTVFDYCIKNQCVLLGWGGDVDFSECSDKEAIERLIAQEHPEMPDAKKTSQAWHVDYFKHDMKVGDIIVVSLGNKLFRAIAEVTGGYEFAEDAPFHQMRAVKWLGVFEAGRPADEIYSKEVGMSSLYKLNPTAIKFDQMQALLSAQVETRPTEPHVLIIDEINRANISKVFGELITLIEPDKREGEPNAITLKLPYSGDDFSVPSNLHIVGTMNTADRSIALLDTALRRRFEFEEVMPDPEKLSGVVIDGVDLDLARLLRALNERVEALYDRDHTIGHAYFMSVQTLDDLDAVFRRRVLPLLQEYFFENWAKVRRVLNDFGEGSFIRKVVKPVVPSDGEEDGADEPAVVYSVNPQPFPVAAYQHIYAK